MRLCGKHKGEMAMLQIGCFADNKLFTVIVSNQKNATIHTVLSSTNPYLYNNVTIGFVWEKMKMTIMWSTVFYGVIVQLFVKLIG